jgi:N-acetylglutamate synthase-like GNAT family acetyltransferase
VSAPVTGSESPIPGLRLARAEDAPAVTALVRAAYGKYVARIGREPKPMVADYRRAIAAHQFWVLEEAGALIAVLELIAEPDHLLIENIAVDPARQGHGLGHRLMDFAETEARRQGFAELRLYTNERFAENLALYGRLGYRTTYLEPLTGTHIVHMAKRLD